MGLETDLRKMKQARMKPLYLGGASWLFISILSLGLVELFYEAVIEAVIKKWLSPSWIYIPLDSTSHLTLHPT